MKHKFLSIFTALVLALSLCLVTAVPAGAVDEQTWTVRPITLEWVGQGSAAWVTESYAGAQSVQLSVGDGAGADDYAEVSITPVGIKVSELELDNTSFWCKSTAGENIPYFIFETDVGTRFNTDADSSADYGDWAEYFASDTPQWQWSDGTWGSWDDIVTEYGDKTITCVIVESPGADMVADPPFTSYVDDITVNGATYELEEPNYNTISAAIGAASDNDTINVTAGDYGERITIDKPLTLLGANAGIHPAVGTHLTETVGTRGPETILSEPGTRVVVLDADDITIDGFKFTGEGYQTIVGDTDSNNFHLTNCIFDTSEPFDNGGVLQFGSGSHTDCVFDFNLFQDPGQSGWGGTIYAHGDFSGLRLAYNKFIVRAWALVGGPSTDPLVGAIIEGNEFDGTNEIADWRGYAGFDISYAGNIVIRDNWFHDGDAALRAGIVGGSITGNIFERIYHNDIILHGGLWDTEVSANVLIENNAITYNDVTTTRAKNGILLEEGDEAGEDIDGSTIHIHNNNFIDGGLYPDVFAISGGIPETVVDAENNWWGNASGPADAVKLAATGYTAYGGSVSANVDYEPWLLEEVNIADPDPTTYDKTLALKDGWTLVSTNKAVADTTSDADTTTSVLKYATDDVSGELAWGNVTVAALEPVDVLCIKTDGGGGVGIDYVATQSGVSSKSLWVGWNLISSGTTGESAYDILSPLPYATLGGAQAVGLTTLVSQGDYNQFSGGFYIATLDQTDWTYLRSITLSPYDGYWIHMNASSDFGVITD